MFIEKWMKLSILYIWYQSMGSKIKLLVEFPYLIISLLNELNDVYKLTEKLNLSKIIIQNLKEHVKSLGSGKYNFDDIIAVDKKSVEIKEFAKRIALTDSNVLITGESGIKKVLR